MYGFDKKAVCLYQSGLWQGHKRSALIIFSMNCTIFSFGTSSTKESSENHENRTQFLVFSLSFFWEKFVSIFLEILILICFSLPCSWCEVDCSVKENIIKEEVGLDVLSDNGITDMGSHI